MNLNRLKGLERKHDYVIESSVLTLRQPLIQTCQQGKLRSILKYTAQLNFASVAGRDVTIQDINIKDEGRFGWYMGRNVWSAGPEIEKYHEFNNQISLFQQKDQKILGGHMTYFAPCHWSKTSSHEEYQIQNACKKNYKKGIFCFRIV